MKFTSSSLSLRAEWPENSEGLEPIILLIFSYAIIINVAESSSNQEIAYTSTEIIGEQTLHALNDLEARVREEEKSEDFKSRHPLNGAIFNLHFVDSVIQPIVAELFTKTEVKKVDLNTWKVFSGARITYLQDTDRAEDGVNLLLYLRK